MKNLYFFVLLLAFIISACKEKDFETNPIDGVQLLKIELSGKVYQNFEYENGKLTKENWYGFCESNPTDEHIYTYQNQQLAKINTTSRSLYSSLSAICNPDLGIKSEKTFEYDLQNRLVKSIQENSYSEFIYDSNDKIIKQILHFGSNSLTATFEYDTKGNLIKETNFNGDVVSYEYDNNPNPFFQMRQRPDWISPFNQSPNNVIKSKHSSGGFTRSISYNAFGYPSKVLEDNGQTYMYIYN